MPKGGLSRLPARSALLPLAEVATGDPRPLLPHKNRKEVLIMRLRKTAINLRVTENEKKKLEKSARYCGLSLSEYLRKVGLGKEVRATSPQSFYEAYWLLMLLKDRRKTMRETEIDRALEEVVRLLLEAYHDLNGGEEGSQKTGDVPWQ